MPTVAMFPRKVRLDSCEEALALKSLFSVFAGSSGESSFNVALSEKQSSAEPDCKGHLWRLRHGNAMQEKP
jgi:hypothetical protein